MNLLARNPWRSRRAVASCLFGMIGSLVAGAGPGLALGPTPPPPPATAPVQTQSSGFDFGVGPYSEPGTPKRSTFQLDAAVGQSFGDRVSVINSGPTPKQFWIYAADAYSAELGGGFALHIRSDKPVGAATWITLPVQEYTVPAHTDSVIPFRVSVPSDATPGDHVAGVVAEEVVAPDAVNKGAGLTTIHRVAARVYLRVAGPLHPALHVDALTVAHEASVLPGLGTEGTAKVSFSVLNTGNVRIRPTNVRISLTGLGGRELHHTMLVAAADAGAQTRPGQALPDQILPGSKVRFAASFRGLPPMDHVTAHVDLQGFDAGASTAVSTRRSSSFWVIPWLLLGIVLAVVLLLGLLLRRGRGGKAGHVVDQTGGLPSEAFHPMAGTLSRQ